jgi:hypothetical protein
MNNEELIKAVNSLLLVLSEDENDYPDAASYRQVMDRKRRVQDSINTTIQGG